MIAALRCLQTHYEGMNQSIRDGMSRHRHHRQEPQGVAALKISGKQGFLALFSTHPPLDQRIAALKKIYG